MDYARSYIRHVATALGITLGLAAIANPAEGQVLQTASREYFTASPSARLRTTLKTQQLDSILGKPIDSLVPTGPWYRSLITQDSSVAVETSTFVGSNGRQLSTLGVTRPLEVTMTFYRLLCLNPVSGSIDPPISLNEKGQQDSTGILYFPAPSFLLREELRVAEETQAGTETVGHTNLFVLMPNSAGKEMTIAVGQVDGKVTNEQIMAMNPSCTGSPLAIPAERP